MKYEILLCPRCGNAKPIRRVTDIKCDPNLPIKLVKTPLLRLWEYPLEHLPKEPLSKCSNIDGLKYRFGLLNKEDSYVKSFINWKLIDVFGFTDDDNVHSGCTVKSIFYVLKGCNEIYFINEKDVLNNNELLQI